jgi:hypothetical protein
VLGTVISGLGWTEFGVWLIVIGAIGFVITLARSWRVLLGRPADA